MKLLTGLLLVFLACENQSFTVKDVLKAPIHAQCNVDWSWPSTPCSQIQKSLLSQISVWSGEDNCKDGGEKCLYKLINQTDKVIHATHETPVKHYVDDLTFTFSAKDPQCNVHVSYNFTCFNKLKVCMLISKGVFNIRDLVCSFRLRYKLLQLK